MRICVNESDGMHTRSFILEITVIDKAKIGEINIDNIKKAVRKACSEYINTQDGKKTLDYNCGCFNWADFDAVPNKICAKYGFTKNSCPVADEYVDWDEQLIDCEENMKIRAYDIEWDTEDNGEVLPPEELGLPKEVCFEIRLPEDSDEEEITDRACDYLSNTYEYCIKELKMEIIQ